MKQKGSHSVHSRRRRLYARRVVIVVVAVLLVVGLLAGVGYLILPKYRYKPVPDAASDLGIDETDVQFDKKIINVALFGLDSRKPDTFTGLSDCVMILSLNTETKQVKVFSVMRDSLVPIRRNGTVSYNKLNSVYQFGGSTLAIKTLNECFGLDISEYVTVNFYGLAHIIDAVGGVDVTLTQEEVTARGTTHQSGINDYIDEICQYMGEDARSNRITTAGTQHVNGIQAVAYSRIRYVKNTWGGVDDFGRTDRQRYVMEQLFNKALTLSKTQYVSLAKALLPYVETSLSYRETLSLATGILLKSPTFEQMRIPRYEFVMDPPHGTWGSAVYYDLDYASRVIRAVIYDNMTIDQYEELHPVEKNDWYAKRKTTK